MTEFLGLKRLATKCGLGTVDLTLNYAGYQRNPEGKRRILPLELPNLLVDEKVSSVALAVSKARPRQQDEYDTDSEADNSDNEGEPITDPGDKYVRTAPYKKLPIHNEKFKNGRVTRVRHNKILSVLWLKIQKFELSIASLQSLTSDE